MHISLLDAAAALSDTALIQHVKSMVANERQATAQLVAHLAEMDARRLYLGEGCSSLFTYCTQVLHLSEHAAYGRIEAARAARKFPAILEAIAGGALHLTAVNLVAPHLTADNFQRVIAAATHKTKRDVEELVAALHPQPPVQSSVRKLPRIAHSASGDKPTRGVQEHPVSQRKAVDPPVADGVRDPSGGAEVQAFVQPVPRAAIRPLAPEHYLVKFTASRSTHEKLREAQALLRHQVPSGDVAEIVDRALTLLLGELRKARHAATSSPRSTHHASTTGRHVAAAVKREVWARDGGRCAFVGAAGQRCTERGFLEYHHVIPFADGGETVASNLQLRCRAHNRFEAERWSGPGEEDLLREVSPTYGGECRPLPASRFDGWQGTRSRPRSSYPQQRTLAGGPAKSTDRCFPNGDHHVPGGGDEGLIGWRIPVTFQGGPGLSDRGETYGHDAAPGLGGARERAYSGRWTPAVERGPTDADESSPWRILR